MSQAVTPSPVLADSQQVALETEQQESIDRCVERTQSNVKLVDLATSLAAFAAATLGFFLAMVLLDHWVVELTRWMRFAALLGITGGLVWFLARRLLPVATTPVNPVYAAKTIEQAAPSLKNGLINLLLLSRQPQAVRPVIFAGLRRQAAGQVATLPNESFVDHSQLIRVGYLLTALIGVAAFYTLLSPKNPWQTVARVIVPWADIARPARVRIDGVKPGDAELYRGQSLDVQANVEGLRGDEKPSLVCRYGNQVDAVATFPMVASAESQTFRLHWTPDSQTSSAMVSYFIQAGDARSRNYQVQLLDAPHLSVERVTYEYPTYTGLASRQDTGTGDLVALEGTKVFIEGRANQSVRQGYLELFSAQGTASGLSAKPVQALSMQTKDRLVQGRLTLSLAADRKTTPFAAYQLRFTNDRGQSNEQPARYRIQVSPDLAPVVELLEPRRAEIELPANGSTTFEIRALDPDFALTRVRIIGSASQTTRWDESLLQKAPHPGQWIGKATLVPEMHGLQAGDELMVWVEVEDNRHSIHGKPEPNQARTEAVRVRITSADREATPDAGAPDRDSRSQDEQSPSEGDESSKDNPTSASEKNDKTSPRSEKAKPDQNRSDRKSQEDSNESSDSQEPDDAKDSAESEKDSESGQQPKGREQGNTSKNRESQKGDQQNGGEQKDAEQQNAEQQNGEQQDEGGQTGVGESGEGQAGKGKSQSGRGQQGGSGDSGDHSQSSDGGEKQAARDGKPSTSRNTGEAEDGEASDEAASEEGQGAGRGGPGSRAKPDTARPPGDAEATDAEIDDADQDGAASGSDRQNQGAKGGDADDSMGEASGTPENAADDGEPLPSDGSRDGDAFDRILKHMRQKSSDAPKGDARKGEPSNEDASDRERSSELPATEGDAASDAESQDASRDQNRDRSDGAGDSAVSSQPKHAATEDREQRESGSSSNSEPGPQRDQKTEANKDGRSSDKSSSADEKSSDDGDPSGESSAADRNTSSPSSPEPKANGSQGKQAKSDQSGDASDLSDKDVADGGSQADDANASQDGSRGQDRGDRGAKDASKPNESQGAQDDAASDSSTANEPSELTEHPSTGGKTSSGPTQKPSATDGDSSEPLSENDPATGQGDRSQPESNGQTHQPSKATTGQPNPNRVGGEGASNGSGADAEESDDDQADAANLEYAQKATDMALEYLKHEPQQEEVLKRLGWTPEELKAFMRRWQQMRDEAREPQANRQVAQRLQDQFRSLGLRPDDANRRVQRVTKDPAGASRQGGSGSSLPAEYQEQYRAFLKSVPARKP